MERHIQSNDLCFVPVRKKLKIYYISVILVSSVKYSEIRRSEN